MYQQFLDEDWLDDEFDYATSAGQQSSWRARWQRIRQQARRFGTIGRIVSLLTNPLSEPALPPPESPPIVQPDPRRRGAGAGSRFDKYDEFEEFGAAFLDAHADESDALLDLLVDQLLETEALDQASRWPWRRRRYSPSPRPTTSLARAQQMLRRAQKGLARSQTMLQRAANQGNWELTNQFAGVVQRAEAAIARWQAEVRRLQTSRGPYR